MSLMVRSITLRDFRNYTSLSLDNIGDLTVFVGNNAVGKSNIIEAIQLVTALSSFRRPVVDHLLRSGSNTSSVEAHLSDGSRELDVALRIEEGKKHYFLNGKKKRPSDLKGLAPAVVFTPDDLELVKGSHGGRRSALDALGSQLSPNHHVIRKDYENVIRHKNRLLKEESSDDLIASIDEMVVTCGAQLACYRAALAMKLSPLITDLYSDISSQREQVQICYIPSWEQHDPDHMEAYSFDKEYARDHIRSALDARQHEERQRRRALVGPHADKIEFFIDGKNATSFGSQGQQRTLVLAYKLAEVALIEDMLQQRPILLLDDVMSELDAARRSALIEFIEEGTQTFITTANLAYFNQDAFSHARVVSLPFSEEGEGDV